MERVAYTIWWVCTNTNVNFLCPVLQSVWCGYMGVCIYPFLFLFVSDYHWLSSKCIILYLVCRQYLAFPLGSYTTILPLSFPHSSLFLRFFLSAPTWQSSLSAIEVCSPSVLRIYPYLAFFFFFFKLRNMPTLLLFYWILLMGKCAVPKGK